jgi:small subunit ribosomal protein S16
MTGSRAVSGFGTRSGSQKASPRIAAEAGAGRALGRRVLQSIVSPLRVVTAAPAGKGSEKERWSMAVRIRLRRTGKRNAASHRIVVADSRSPRDGRFIETIGVYDPRHKYENIDLERVDYWLPRGAQPSETVAAIIRRAKAGIPMRPKDEKPAAQPEPVASDEAPPAPAEDAAGEVEEVAADQAEENAANE